MALNINGYNLSYDGGIKFGASSTKVDSNARVLVPNQPIMFGSHTGYADHLRQYPWAVNSLGINVNSAWSTSSFVFTCPVAGLYYTALSTICLAGASPTASATNSGYNGVIKNGALQHFTHWNTNDYWDTQNLETILSCAAGDTISWAIHVAPAPDNGSGRGAYGDNHNMATIWLMA
jgi:hypothetical protein